MSFMKSRNIYIAITLAGWTPHHISVIINGCAAGVLTVVIAALVRHRNRHFYDILANCCRFMHSYDNDV